MACVVSKGARPRRGIVYSITVDIGCVLYLCLDESSMTLCARAHGDCVEGFASIALCIVAFSGIGNIKVCPAAGVVILLCVNSLVS